MIAKITICWCILKEVAGVLGLIYLWIVAGVLGLMYLWIDGHIGAVACPCPFHWCWGWFWLITGLVELRLLRWQFLFHGLLERVNNRKQSSACEERKIENDGLLVKSDRSQTIICLWRANDRKQSFACEEQTIPNDRLLVKRERSQTIVCCDERTIANDRLLATRIICAIKRLGQKFERQTKSFTK